MAESHETVTEYVIQQILSKELKPGQALPPERELAQSLGVSRPLVREALRTLAAMNIVESRRGAGTYVTDLTPALLLAPLTNAFRLVRGSHLDLFQTRRIIEPQAAALAASTITDDDLVELDALIAELDDADAATFPAKDVAFHEWIIARVGNPILVGIVHGIRDLEFITLALTADTEEARIISGREHHLIVDALHSRDAERARAATLLHLARAEELIREREQNSEGSGGD